MLGVKISRQKSVERDVGIQYRVERSYMEMRHTLALPPNADPDHAQANLSNGGVLNITFPKLVQTAGARKIPVLKM